MGLATYAASDEPEVAAFLHARPFAYAYPAWLLATGQIGRRSDVVLWRDERDAVAGLAYLAARIVPASESPEALAAFAALAAARIRDPRMIVGAKRAVDGFWRHAAAALPAPYAVRERQPVFAVDRRTLRGGRDDADVGRATAAEVDEIAAESAQMTSGELDGHPVAVDAAYLRRTRNIIDAGWYWRARVEGRLTFICHLGAATPQTAQIHGVWTPPAMRGRGHATRAFGAICDRLLDEHPSLSLYVNDFNHDAVAFYERLGFTRVEEFSTILFG